MRIAVVVAVVALLASPVLADPYFSGGAGVVNSLSTTRQDNIEYQDKPWLSIGIAVGDDRIFEVGEVDIGLELGAAVVPMAPIRGTHNSVYQPADGQHTTAYGITFSLVALVPLTDRLGVYMIGGDGFAYVDSGVGTGQSALVGLGLRYDLTERLAADGSFRWRSFAGVGFYGPELQLVWRFQRQQR